MTTLEQHIREETEELETIHRDSNYKGYVLTRTWLSHNFAPIAESLPANPKILEVGMGTGENLIAITRENLSIRLENCVGTCLQLLPEHDSLISSGLQIIPGMLAEFLPKEWNNCFDVAMLSLVLCWADDWEGAIQRLGEVTKVGGYLLAFEEPLIIRQVEKNLRRKFNNLEPALSFIEGFHGALMQKVRD